MAETGRYITTPIFYVNDRPHIGHVYTTTLCDAYARFMRLSGQRVFFLTGTDEHGQKVEKAAASRGVTAQAWADENAAEFQRVFAQLELSNDDFIRTTQPDHTRQVQTFVSRLLAAGDVYLGEFEGWYDEDQEEYHTETKAKELNFASPVSKKPLTRAREKNYYFRLSAYQQRLEEFFAANPGFVRPEARRNEVLGRLREGLQDVPVSRTNFTWGIKMPNDPAHVIYVWIDALFNYITALGLGEADDSPRRSERSHFWPASYHVIGKEILWFHAVIWPAILMALKLPAPRCVYAHSFWISEGQKMSKSMGNFIDLNSIDRYVKSYGLDAWRYYLVTQGPLGTQDANFAAAHFHDVYHTDLVNTVGNCSSRVTAMVTRYFDGVLPDEDGGNLRRKGSPTETPTTGRTPPRCNTSATRGATPPADDRGSTPSSPIMLDGFHWPSICREAVERFSQHMERFELSDAAATALNLLRRIDAFINATEPFKIAKDAARTDDLGAILYQCTEAVRIASLLLWPILPEKMAALWEALGLSIDPEVGGLSRLSRWGGLRGGSGAKIQKVALYPRVEQAPAPAGTAA